MLEKIKKAAKAIKAAEEAGASQVQIRIEDGPVWFDIRRSMDKTEFYFSGFYNPEEDKDGPC